MYYNQQLQNSNQLQYTDSEGKEKTPLPTLEPPWQLIPFPLYLNVPNRNTAISTAPMPIPSCRNDIATGIGGFQDVRDPSFPPTTSITQQVNELTMSSRTCDECSLVFYSRSEIEKHMEQHHPDFRYRCTWIEASTFCNKMFKSEEGLQIYRRSHEGTGSTKSHLTCPVEGCDFLEKIFSSTQAKYKHMVRKHPHFIPETTEG